MAHLFVWSFVSQKKSDIRLGKHRQYDQSIVLLLGIWGQKTVNIASYPSSWLYNFIYLLFIYIIFKSFTGPSLLGVRFSVICFIYVTINGLLLGSRLLVGQNSHLKTSPWALAGYNSYRYISILGI